MDTSTVPNYNDVYNSLGSVYDPQTKLVQSQIDALQPEQDAQQASLEQAKVNAFKDISNSANSKGVLFSGFTPDQQATYVGTKYLPAVANLKTSFNNTKNTLLGQINTIMGNRSKQASDTVASASKQASTDAYRNAQLQLGYARLGASSSAAASKPLTQTQTVAAIRAGLESVKGKDGHVAPQDLKMAYKDWASAGYDPNSFWKYYQGYWNSNQGNYKQQFNAA